MLVRSCPQAAGSVPLKIPGQWEWSLQRLKKVDAVHEAYATMG